MLLCLTPIVDTVIMPEFLLIALIGGLITPLMTAPIGAFMLWLVTYRYWCVVAG